MFKALFFTLLTCLLLQDDEAALTWREDLKLQWSNFKAEPQPQGDAVALTASGITFGFSSKKSETELIDFSYNISAQFYPDRSWYIKKPLKDIVLDHERLHFDITELHARKFKQRLSSATFSLKINAEMGRIHDAINVELGEMQKKYDKKTNHSQIAEKQKEWQDFITKELERLSKYK